MAVEVLNPTGVAFDRAGELFVTARAEGEVVRIADDAEAVRYASDLGIATGIAFDRNGAMFVGDRSGTIYRLSDAGVAESFVILEPSVSAYHLAFGADGKLYVAAPVFRVSTEFTRLTAKDSTKSFIVDSADRKASPLTVKGIYMWRRVCTGDTAS
jgi:glucose/arabinose dehydrogenase